MQRAMNAFRAVMPVVQRLLPLLEGNVLTAISNVLTPRPQAPPPAPKVDLAPLESSLTELHGRVCLATFELTDEELRCTAVSQARLDAAIELVEQRLGTLAELYERNVLPLEPDLSSRRRDHAPRRREPPPGLTATEAHDLESRLLNYHYRRWLDEPLKLLGGHTPREAARNGRRGELELLLRGIENRAERSRRDGAPWPDVSWLRDELGLNAGRLAA